MRELGNYVKQLAQSNQIALMRVGTVASYDPTNYCVKVTLQPEGVTTGWLPLVSAWVGNGWGMFSPPSIGDQIEVQFHDGDFDAGVACQRFFTDVNRPLTVPSGEFWLVHKSGSFVKLLSDGSISSKGTWNHQGDINVSGTVTGTTDVVGGGKSLKTHTHPVGGGNTGAPN